jgi:hypothetical protein
MHELKHVWPPLSKAERIVSQVLDGDLDPAELKHALSLLKETRWRAEVQLALIESLARDVLYLGKQIRTAGVVELLAMERARSLLPEDER